MSTLPLVPITRLGVVSGPELIVAGWTPSAIRHAVRCGRLERIAPGRFAPPPPGSLTRFQCRDLALARRSVAATLVGGRVAVSHLGAAWIRGWPIWAADPAPCVTTWDRRVCRVDGVHLHRVRDVGALARLHGLPATAAARTVVDIAREFGTEAALVSGDVALRTGYVTRASLTTEIEVAVGLPGVGRARPLPELLDPLAESPLESRGRWQCHLHGLPRPHSQILVHTRTGELVGRVDHFWGEGVVGEADGRLKYDDDPDALPKEKNRQQRLEDLELEVVRWGAADLRDFTAAAARVTRARDRARRRLGDGPRLWVATTLSGVRIPVADTP